MIRKKKSDLHLKIGPLENIDRFVVPQTPLTTPQIIVQSPSSNHLPFADAEDDEEVPSVVVSDTPRRNGGIHFAANDGRVGAEDYKEVPCVFISDNKPRRNAGIQFQVNEEHSDTEDYEEVPCVLTSNYKPRRNGGIKFAADDGLLEGEELDSNLIHPPESDAEERKRSLGLRRNSVSLPAGINNLDIEMLRQQHRDHPANVSSLLSYVMVFCIQSHHA